MRVVVQSELVANEALPTQRQDPRVGAALESPLESEEHRAQGTVGLLVHHTRVSGLRIGVAMDHRIQGPPEMVVESVSFPDVSRVSVITRLKPGERLRIVKFVAYGWSSLLSRPAIHDQVMAALSAARLTGWEGLLAEQRAYLDNFWAGADVELEGDPEIQQAVRFALFHVLQAGARAERWPIPAKGLTGLGYDGHAFWDTEIFVLPVLAMTFPPAAADALRWRQSLLPHARELARQLGLRGAAFPWRTILGADVQGTGLRVLPHSISTRTLPTLWPPTSRPPVTVRSRRRWASSCSSRRRGYGVHSGTSTLSPTSSHRRRHRTRRVQRHRRQQRLHQPHGTAQPALGGKSVKRYPEKARALGVEADEAASWREAAEKMLIPYDERLGVTPQDETFTKHEVWDFAHVTPDQYPLFLHFPFFDLYRKQVVKQADLVLAMHLRGDAFTPEQKARNFAYYEAITVRDSSLSASTQAVLAAEVGQLQLAYDYLGEAAFMDLHDLAHNARDGLHMASLAGVWTALVAGFGALRLQHGLLRFSPRLPEALGRLAFHLLFRGCRLYVEVTATEATYRTLDGTSLKVRHYGEEILLPSDGAVTRPIPPVKAGPRPRQPPGREPIPP